MIISFSDLPKIRSEHRDKRIVFACGVFDVVHVGHIDHLTFARSKGDILVVGTPSDISITKQKGPTRPLNTLHDRMSVIDALRVVDYVVPLDRYGAIIKVVGGVLEPDVYVIYHDKTPEDIAELRMLFPGAQVVVDMQDKIRSTTAMVDKIRVGD